MRFPSDPRLEKPFKYPKKDGAGGPGILFPRFQSLTNRASFRARNTVTEISATHKNALVNLAT